jgi:hypothetical protein
MASWRKLSGKRCKIPGAWFQEASIGALFGAQKPKVAGAVERWHFCLNIFLPKQSMLATFSVLSAESDSKGPQSLHRSGIEYEHVFGVC